MKEALYFHIPSCPYCKFANRVIEEVKKEPKYANVEFKPIDESKNKKFVKDFDYRFTPTFFVDGVKVYEAKIGYIFQPEDCRRIFDLILE